MSRLGMALYAVWVAFALVAQDATPCPTHDGPAAAAVMMATTPSTMRMGHGAHSHGAHHACTCVGCGCCVATLDPPSPTHSLVPAPAVILRVAEVPRAASCIGARRVDRLLPFPNAPPVMVNTTV